MLAETTCLRYEYISTSVKHISVTTVIYLFIIIIIMCHELKRATAIYNLTKLFMCIQVFLNVTLHIKAYVHVSCCHYCA